MARRPNVMFILSDDQGPWAMGCAGNGEIRTPSLDRLAAEGLRFSNFFCASPVCSPARASIMTGRIPSQHGVHDWLSGGNSTIESAAGGKLIEYLAGQPGYTEFLARDGYVCGLSGKWHLGDAHHAQKGFTFWRVHACGGSPYYGAPMVKDAQDVYYEAQYVTDAITENALRFLEERPTDGPFYLGVHYTAPHSPWNRDQHPAEYFEPYYDACAFESVPDVPMHPWARANSGFFESSDKRREWLSGYFAAVTAMDAGVGLLLDRLDDLGLREDTLIVFMSDNGMNMGHHGICGKGNGTYPQNMYDTSVKVPCLISRPGHVPRGRVSAALCSQYDVMPTLLDYAGIRNAGAEGLPGVSFAGLLRGEETGGRESVVVFDEYGPVRMIRSATHKYVYRYPDGPHEFYDLVADPDEKTDLSRDAAHASLINDMRAQLRAWFARYVIPERDGLDKPVTGHGQSGLVSDPEEGNAPFAQGLQT